MSLRLALWLLGGVGVGLLNTLLLIWGVALLDPGYPGGSLGRALWLYLLRATLSGALLLFAVQQGIVPLLAAGAGMWVARWFGVWIGQSRKLAALWSRGLM
jgi:hypothetical protein